MHYGYTTRKPVVQLVLFLLLIVLFVVILQKAKIERAEQDSSKIAAPEATEQPVSKQSYEHSVIRFPLLYDDVAYVEPVKPVDAARQLDLITDLIENLKGASAYGNYTKQAITQMHKEQSRLELIAKKLQSDLDRFVKWENEYPYAARTWYFLRERGYTKEVSAGIIGNMMIETSGGSLALKPVVYNPTRAFYGLCQWSLRYFPEVEGMTFIEQLRYLYKSMPKEFDSFGFCYRDGFTYEDFLVVGSPEEAAYIFAKVYERCGAGSYNLRKKAARAAYEYFN